MRILFTSILLAVFATWPTAAQEDTGPSVDQPAEVATDPSSISIGADGTSDTTPTLPDAGVDTTAPAETTVTTEPPQEPPSPSPAAKPAKTKPVVHMGTKKKTASSTVRSKARADSIARARAKRSTTGTSAFTVEMDPTKQYERILTVELGLKFYPTSYPSFPTPKAGSDARVDTLAPAGFLAGVLVPIRVPFVTTTYRAKFSFNKIHKEYSLDGRDKSYIQASNELLFGRAMNIRAMPDLQYLPQGGIGFNNGISVGRDRSTDQIKGMHTHYFWSYTLSLAVRKRNFLPKVPKKKNPMVGGMFYFTRAFIADEDTKQSLCVSLTLGY